jgi:hypothetical protein
MMDSNVQRSDGHHGAGQLKWVRNALDKPTISKDPKRKAPAFIAIAVERE